MSPAPVPRDRLGQLPLGQDPVLLAPRLLGWRLVSHLSHGDLAAPARVEIRLTEVEAYGDADDPGSHAFRGRTRRNATMFGPPGHLYVYFTYGMHWCANVVGHEPGRAGAALLRAGEVTDGLATAWARRPRARGVHELASGPARLCQALGLDGQADGFDLLDPASPVRLLPPGSGSVDQEVETSARTGVGGAGAATPWRFFLVGEPSVSRYRPATARRRPAADP